ncbi:unnamed protein product [Amaranthus hypochondriacus]
MDRFRSRFDKQQIVESPTGSPMGVSPVHRHARSSSSGLSNMKKPATKAAAQRLAQVMASAGDDEDEDEDDLLVDYQPVGALGGLGRPARATPSPRLVRPAATDQPKSLRNPMSARPSFSVKTNEQPIVKPSSGGRLSQPSINTPDPSPSSTHLASSVRSPRSFHNLVDLEEDEGALSGRSSLSVKTNVEHSGRTSSTFRTSSSASNIEQLSVHSVSAERSSLSLNTEDLNPSTRSTPAGKPVIKTVPLVPPAVTLSLKQQTPSSPAAGSISNRRMKVEFGSSMISRQPKEHIEQLSSSALQDELDMLHEEHDNLLDKLRLAEERLHESEARAKQLEKQVANLGEGVSMEARLLSRKEAALQQRENALRAASQKFGKTGDITALMMKAESAKDELLVSESELRNLRSTVQRLKLTQEEMEEVVLKRCWLARYWGLCVEYGIYSDIAGVKLDYWSSLAPLPFEIVVAAGQKAKEDRLSAKYDDESEQISSELSVEGSAESMLIVERGLRELAALKVEDAIRVAMVQQRRNMQKPALTDGLRSPSQKFGGSFELSKEESQEVHFKQAWLMYFWRRACNHAVESDIAEERLHFWIDHSAQASTSHDAVDVERGLLELRKLGLENQLWEESRKWTEQDF